MNPFPMTSASRTASLRSAPAARAPLFRLLLLAVFAWLASATALATSYRGRVTYNGFAVPNVQILLEGSGSTFTDSDGRYDLDATGISSGSTDLKATKAGYAFPVVEGVSRYLRPLPFGHDVTINFAATSGPQPTLNQPNPFSGTEDVPTVFTLTGVGLGDPDLPMTLTFSTSTSVSDAVQASVDYTQGASTAVLTLKSATNVVGAYGITVTATRSDGTNISRVLNYTINQVNDAPVVGPGTALALNGTDQYIRVREGVWFDGSPFTVEGWVYVRSYASYSRLFDFGNGQGNDNVLGALTAAGTGIPYFEIYRGGSAQTLIASQQIPLNTWTHLAFTYDAARIAHIYINGADAGSKAMDPPNNIKRNLDYFGRSNWGSDKYADANFADLRIWSEARTPAQLQATRFAAIPPRTPNLLLNYRFNEGSGTLIKDLANDFTTQLGDNPGSVPAGTLFLGPLFVPTNSIELKLASAQKVEIPSFGTLTDVITATGKQAATIEFWQRIDAKVQQSSFILTPDAIGNRINAHVPWDDGQVIWDWGNIGGGGRLTYTPPVSLVGQWTHFAFVVDEASADGLNMKIYRNGVLEASKSGMSRLTTRAANLTLAPGGRMADFRVWNVQRSGSQIRGSMFAPVAPDSVGLIVNLRFTETSGTVIADVAPAGGNQNGNTVNSPTLNPPATVGSLEGLVSQLVIPVRENSSRVISLPAADVEGSKLTFGGSAKNGTLTEIPGGSGDFVYTPNPNFTGLDTITYICSDPDGGFRYSAIQVAVTPVNDPPVVGPGTSVTLDGTDDHIVLPSQPLANKSFSLEFWARRADTSGPDFVLGSDDAGALNKSLHVGFRPEGTFTFAFYGNDLNTPAYTDTDWHHWACTYDATTRMRKIYRDGVQVATDTASANFQGTGNLLLGRNSFATDSYFKGGVADVRIWSTVRTAAEIAGNLTPGLLNSTSGLLAYYRLNEGAGLTAFDSATTDGAQNGSLKNGVVWRPVDGPTNSLALDGISQHASLLSTTNLVITNTLTIEAWIFPRTVAKTLSIVNKYGANDGGYSLNLQVGGILSASVLDKSGTGFSSTVLGLTAIQPNVWTHVAMRCDGNVVQVFVNGVLDGTALAGRYPKLGSTPLYLGANNEGTAFRFEGRLGDVRLWNVARTDAEIAAYRGGVATNAPGLVLNYKFTGAAGGTVANVAGTNGALTAALVGNPTFLVETNLATLQVVKYTEDVALQVTLPAFDPEGASLTYSGADAGSAGKITGSGSVVTFTPTANYNGPVTLNYQVSDGLTTVPGRMYLQGIPVEDGPTLDLGDLVNGVIIGEGSGVKEAGFALSDGDPELLQLLSISATSSNTNLIRNPVVLGANPSTNEMGHIAYKPRPGMSGVATITVTVKDLVSNLSVSKSFNVTVTPVDDPPNVGPATSLAFNGANYVNVPGFGASLPLDELTVEFWQRATVSNAGPAFQLVADDAASRFDGYAPGSDGRVTWDFGNTNPNNTGPGRLAYIPPVSILNSWQHFAFVISRSGNYMKIFRNGIEEATRPGVSTVVPGVKDLRLGQFAGQLAEFRVWKVARTGEEILANLHASLPNETANLVVYYRFNQKPTTTLTDFASAPGQSGAQDGQLIADSTDFDPIWKDNPGTQRWQSSDPNLLALQVITVGDGTSNRLFLPAWDAEGGLTNLTWNIGAVSTGTVTKISGGLVAYLAPSGYSGPATLNYTVKDSSSSNAAVAGVINLKIVVANNDAPTIALIPNQATEEDTAVVEIPFTVADDQPAERLIITPTAITNPDLIKQMSVPPGGNYRTLNVVPRPGFIGTVRLRVSVQDQGNKTAQTEFDLRIEPKPAFSVIDLGVLPGKAASFGTAINDQGAVAGYMTDTADRESNAVGFLYGGLQNSGDVTISPPSLVGPSPFTAPFRIWAMNNSYTMGGGARVGATTVAWYKTDADLLPNSLSTLPGGTNAVVRAINDAGLLVGTASNADGKLRAFSYSSVSLTDLGLAPAPFNAQSEAYGLNLSNHIVGAISATDGRRRAAINLGDGNGFQPLFSVPDDINSVANGINVFDQVVGRTTVFAAGDTALSFDGKDDMVTAPNLLANTNGTPLVAGNAAHTIEAWIKVAELPPTRSWPVLLGTNGPGAHHWLVNKDGAGGTNLYVGIFNGGGVVIPLTNALGAWLHVAAAYDPFSSTLVAYLNGQPFGTNTVTGVNLQGIPLILGAPNEDRFKGALDEVRVWRTTRTATEIAANYTRRLAGNEGGLVAWFPFDEMAGAATTSQAAGNLVGTLAGDPVREVRGGLPSPSLTVNQPALQFDGVSSRVVLPSLALANSSFTVEFWSRRTGVDGSADYVVGQGNGTANQGLFIGFRPDNKFTFSFSGSEFSTTGTYGDTLWHHWACTFDSASKKRRIYRDGVQVMEDTATANFQGTGPVVLGQAPWLSNSWFKGALDDVRFWNVVRTADEINDNKNNRLRSATTGLLAHYLFDEGGGNTTVNHATGVVDASLQGAVGWIGFDTGTSRAFRYETQSGRLSSLGTVTGGGNSVANAINDFGQVVGTADMGVGTHAFFHSAGKMNDLNDLLPEEQMLDQWNLETANAINRSGAVVGTASHSGRKRAYIAVPATVIGRPVIRPEGAIAGRIPQITLLKTHRSDDTTINSFYWSSGEDRLYAIRPVTAKLEWFTSNSDTVGTGTNIMSNTNRIVSVTVNVWPKEPAIHIAGAPVDLQPVVTAEHYTFQSLIYVTNRASVEPSAKVFTSPDEGYTVAFYLKNDGLPVAASQPAYFEVIRTVKWDDYHAKPTEASCVIGQELTDPNHAEYDEKNGYVLFEKAAYDGYGTDKAYDRGTRLGPILPVNLKNPGGNTNANPEDLVVVWYRTNRIGVAWASVPVRYSPRWPNTNEEERIIIASQLGSGYLDGADYPAKQIYNQADITQAGFNPNEEHALMPVDTLYALRDDLNQIRNYSEPYSILKYRDPLTTRWKMRVFRIVAEEAPYFFTYTGTVGKEVQPPLPLSLLPLSLLSYQEPTYSNVGWEDYKGKFYARQAGPEGSHTNLVIRWFYPLQPGFFHPDTNKQIGDPLAWLDQRKTNQLRTPNEEPGTVGTPIDVTYDIRWDAEPTLQIGESLLHSKRGLPDVYNMANARVIFDSLLGPLSGGTNLLARFYDPISARTITSGVAIPDSIKRQNIGGKDYFPDLPWFLKIRLFYDPVNNALSFKGYLDENFGVGEPLLLPNVLSARERDRIEKLADGNSDWEALIERLYDLTRNPNQLDMDPYDGLPDQALRLGLIREERTNFFEVVGTNKTVVTVPATLFFPSYDSNVFTKVTYPPPATVEDARTLDSNLLSAFNKGKFLTLDGAPPHSSYEIFIGPTTTIETGPKALTAGLGGIPSAPARPGNALSFDGTTGVVAVGSNELSALDLASTPFTIEFWARPTDPAREQYIFGQAEGDANLGKLRLGFRAGGKFAFDLGTNAATVSVFTTSATYADTDWHHWAGTFDPETKIQSIYRDGVMVASRTNSALSYGGFGTVELGRFGDGLSIGGVSRDSQYYKGLLDEVRVWKTARTGAEIRSQMNKRQLGGGVEPKLEILYRCDETAGPLASDAVLQDGLYPGTLNGGVSLVTSDAPTGIPPRYITIAENNDPKLGGLPVALHVIRVDDGPFLGDLKVLPGDNVFDERLTMRHSSDFGGDPGPVEFEWYYKPIGADFDPTDLPVMGAGGVITDFRQWIPYSDKGPGVNYITTGEGKESGLITISDNAFICRYRGYAVNLNSAAVWSGWVGDPSGTPEQPRAALAEGWVKRVIRGLNPFDARTSDFHSSPVVTFASMLIQAGHRYEGPIAFNPAADAINKVGLIEAYTTVLERAKGLSIEGVPPVDFNPANNALLLAATRVSDLYTVLGNEAYADASDPTIGFSTGSKDYGSLASSIFAFQNQLDSLLEEELTLLRGRDDSAAGVGANPVYNRLFWNFTLGEGEVAYQQNYNISDQDQNGFIDEKDARILYPQGHGDAWGHYLMAMKQHYDLLRHPFFTWIPRSELVSVAGAAIKVDFLDERKFATVAAAKAKAGAEIVDLTYRLNYVDDPSGQWQGYKDTRTGRGWGVTEWSRRAGTGAYFDWLTGNTILPSSDPNPAHTGIDKIDRQTVRELDEIPAQYAEIQTRLDQADAGLNPLGLAKGVVPFDIDPSLVSGGPGIPGKTHYEQIQDRALKAMQNALSVWDEVNKSTEALRRNQDSVEQLTENVTDQERDYKNRLIEIFGYPYAGDIGPGKTYPSGYDGPDIYKYMYVPAPDFDGLPVTPDQDAKAYFTPMNLGIKSKGDTTSGAFGDSNEQLYFPDDFISDLASSTNALSSTGGTNRILQVTYPRTTGRFPFNPPASYGQRQAPGEIQLALSDLIQSEARLRVAVKNDDALFAEIDSKVHLLNERYAFRAEQIKLQSDLANTKIAFATTIIGLKAAQGYALSIGKTVLRTADVVAEGLPTVAGLAYDVTSAGRAAIKASGATVENANSLIAAGLDAAAMVIQQIALPAAEGIVNSKIQTAGFKYEIQVQLEELDVILHKLASSQLEGIRLAEAVNQANGRYLAALAKGQRLLEERVAFRIKTSARTTENRYQDMTFRVFRNDALQKYRATFDLAQRFVFLAATAYDYESNLLGTDTRSGRNFLTDIIRQRSLGQMLNGVPVIGRSGLADPLARMNSNFDVLKTQLGFNNPQTETGRFSLRNELFRLRDSSDADWRAQLATLRVTNLWDLPEFRRYCRAFAPESAGPQPGLVIRFPTAVLAGKNFFNWPLGGGDSAYDSSRFATKVRSAGVWFTGYNGLGLSQTPRVYLVPVGSDVLSSPTPNDFVTRGWRVVDQALPVPFPIGANRLADPAWIPVNDSLGGSFAEIRRFASFRAYHDSGGFNPNEVTSDSRLIGRSVWNTDWVLIIPGQTFLANPNAGLDVFLNSVSDIKLFFQTYSYSGN